MVALHIIYKARSGLSIHTCYVKCWRQAQHLSSSLIQAAVSLDVLKASPESLLTIVFQVVWSTRRRAVPLLNLRVERLYSVSGLFSKCFQLRIAESRQLRIVMPGVSARGTEKYCCWVHAWCAIRESKGRLLASGWHDSGRALAGHFAAWSSAPSTSRKPWSGRRGSNGGANSCAKEQAAEQLGKVRSEASLLSKSAEATYERIKCWPNAWSPIYDLTPTTSTSTVNTTYRTPLIQ